MKNRYFFLAPQTHPRALIFWQKRPIFNDQSALNILRKKFFQAIILCFWRTDSGHFGDKIPILNKIWYFAVQTHFSPNFVGIFRVRCLKFWPPKILEILKCSIISRWIKPDGWFWSDLCRPQNYFKISFLKWYCKSSSTIKWVLHKIKFILLQKMHWYLKLNKN